MNGASHAIPSSGIRRSTQPDWGCTGIEVHDHHDGVRPVGERLAVREQLLALHRVEPERAVVLQGRMLPPDHVDAAR